jgi:hypothetical protein
MGYHGHADWLQTNSNSTGLPGAGTPIRKAVQLYRPLRLTKGLSGPARYALGHDGESAASVVYGQRRSSPAPAQRGRNLLAASHCQLACKPGSVWPRPRRNVAAIHLGRRLPSSLTQPTRTAGPGNGPEGCPSRHPYSVLLPVGFTVPLAVARRAVGSYPTLSPLPRQGRQSGRFALCGTFPGVAPAGRYPAPCFRGARTFLTCRLSALTRAAARPAGFGRICKQNSATKPPPFQS